MTITVKAFAVETEAEELAATRAELAELDADLAKLKAKVDES